MKMKHALPACLPVRRLDILKVICCGLIIQFYHAIKNDQWVPGEKVRDVMGKILIHSCYVCVCVCVCVIDVEC